MTARTRRRGLAPALAAAASLVALLPLTGCGPSPDPNFAAVTDGRLSVDRPSAWSTTMPVEAPWKQGFRLAPDSVEQIQVTGDFGDYVSAAEAAGHLVGIGQVGLAGFTVVATRDLEVKDTSSAQAVRYTITDNTGSQVTGEWIVAVRWPERQSVAVSLLTPRYDPDLERRVIESIKVAPG